ncbi:MAG: hypothetical protein M3237_15820 [Actinomycetota bacterium]|nr:hypothetical protein [Actinomycetota bacterium]
MSLDNRLRAGLRQSADVVDPAVDVAFSEVLAERDRRARSRRRVPVALATACLVVVGALLAMWLPGGPGADDTVATDPPAETGTYEAVLGGDLAGTWRLRLGDGSLSLVAPDTEALGTRLVSASYQQEGDLLTTDLLVESGPCASPASYRWAASDEGLSLRVEDDDCELRSRLLSSEGWGRVGGPDLPEGSYRSETLSPDRMQEAGLAAGYPAADIDDYIGSAFPEFEALTYTLQLDGDEWVVYESVDGGPPAVAWAGPYDVVDEATIVAGEAPCGPITYDYRWDGDRLVMVVLDDECIENGKVPVGELVAQTTTYESSPFTRAEE